MRRAVFLALLGTLALVRPTSAQERIHPARLTIAPVLGIRAPLARDQRTTVVIPSLLPVVVDLGPDRGSGEVAGLEADLRLAGPIGVSAGFLYSAGDPFGVLLQGEEGVLAQISADGPTLWFLHADVSFRLPDIRVEKEWRAPRIIPAGYLVAGPARVRQDYGGSLLALSKDDVEESWAIHVAYRAQLPLGLRHLVLQASVEDYVPFWDRTHERARLGRLIDLQADRVLSTQVAYNRTHIPMLNVGLALRF